MELGGEAGVTVPQGGSGFGRSALRFHGKIFAMLVRGRLVLKLPASRVEALVAAGAGDPLDANKGTPMREWLSLDPRSPEPRAPPAHEAPALAGRARRPRCIRGRRAACARPTAGYARPGAGPAVLSWASSRARTAGSPPGTSTILVRLVAPVISVTSPGRTPNAAATAASAAAVAWPPTAR